MKILLLSHCQNLNILSVPQHVTSETTYHLEVATLPGQMAQMQAWIVSASSGMKWRAFEPEGENV